MDHYVQLTQEMKVETTSEKENYIVMNLEKGQIEVHLPDEIVEQGSKRVNEIGVILGNLINKVPISEKIFS